MRATSPSILVGAMLLLVAGAARAQQGGPPFTGVPAGPAYTAPPIPDEEAVSVSVTSSATLTNPLVTVLDPRGDESSCILPCTFRSRVGITTFEGARLAVDVELPAAGVTYDVQLTPGPSGEDFALVTALLLTGGTALGLGIWGLTETGEEDAVTLAAIGVGYGGLAVVITLPWLIVMLATIDGTASVTNYRRGLTASLRLTEGGPAFAF
jgi:hypothetical protein